MWKRSMSIASLLLLMLGLCWSSHAGMPVQSGQQMQKVDIKNLPQKMMPVLNVDDLLSKDKAEYGLVEQGGGLVIYGRLIPKLKYDLLPTFEELDAFKANDPLAGVMADRRLIVALQGDYFNCLSAEICYRYVETSCAGMGGTLFRCVISKDAVEGVRQQLKDPNSGNFDAFRVQSAKDKVDFSFKHASPIIGWSAALANEEVDGDGDGVADYRDNCPDKKQVEQSDADGNGVGDACEDVDFGYTPPATTAEPLQDADQDKVEDASDLCPNTAQGDAVNSDGCSDAQLAALIQDPAVESSPSGGESIEVDQLGESADSGGSCSLMAY